MKLHFKEKVFRAQPDPFMCPVEDGWAMYATGSRGVEAYWAAAPMSDWEYRGRIFSREGCCEYWAPCMYYEEGWYYLYVSFQPEGADVSRECLHVTRSRSPFGPFQDVKKLFDCFSIDPHVVSTREGLFLWYCMDNLCDSRVGTRIYVQKLQDPMTPVGAPAEMVKPSFDQEIFMRDRYVPGQHWHTIEGPFWLQVDGWQYVMYSGACYQNDTYHIGYASAPADGQDLTRVVYEKHTKNGEFDPLMTKNQKEEGVGHHSVIFWQGQYYAVYHARDLKVDPAFTGDCRTARICRLRFAEGTVTAEAM